MQRMQRYGGITYRDRLCNGLAFIGLEGEANRNHFEAFHANPSLILAQQCYDHCRGIWSAVLTVTGAREYRERNHLICILCDTCIRVGEDGSLADYKVCTDCAREYQKLAYGGH